MSPALALAAMLVLAPQASPPPGDPRPRPPTASGPTRPGKPSARTSGSTRESRQLILRAKVVLREGYLEHLLCLTRPRNTSRCSPPRPLPS